MHILWNDICIYNRFFFEKSKYNECIFYFSFAGPYTTSKYAEYDESPHPSPSNSENADVSQNSLIKSPFHQNVLTPTVELDSSSTRNNPIQHQQQYSKNSVTSTESLYNGYNRLRFITGGWKNSFIIFYFSINTDIYFIYKQKRRFEIPIKIHILKIVVLFIWGPNHLLIRNFILLKLICALTQMRTITNTIFSTELF